jgi:hypothetical protein
MKKIWYARDKHINIVVCLFTHEPKLSDDGWYDSKRGDYQAIRKDTFRKLFGFTPRKGEKGQLEIRRVKR